METGLIRREAVYTEILEIRQYLDEFSCFFACSLIRSPDVFLAVSELLRPLLTLSAINKNHVINIDSFWPESSSIQARLAKIGNSQKQP